jgi:hypothetical protein
MYWYLCNLIRSTSDTHREIFKQYAPFAFVFCLKNRRVFVTPRKLCKLGSVEVNHKVRKYFSKVLPAAYTQWAIAGILDRSTERKE